MGDDVRLRRFRQNPVEAILDGIAAKLPSLITAAGQSAVPVSAAPAPAVLTSYSQAGVIAINTVLAALDCSQYRSVSIQCASMGTTGVVTPEWSNDNANWVAGLLLTPAGVTASTFNAAGLWVTPVQARYLRLRLSTATTAGTTTLSIHQFDDSRQIWQATQPVSGNVGLQYGANATGAASFVSVQSPATPAAATVKASAGRLVALYLQNSAASLRSVKVFNATAPTLGTTAAAFTVDIPAGGIAQLEIPGGLAFSTAMTYSVTSAKGLTDNTATGLALNDVSGFLAFA